MQTIQYGHPELGAFILANPHSQNIFPPVKVNSDGNIDRLLDDPPFTSDMEVDGIQKYYCINGFQGPLLPFFCDGKDLLSVTPLTVVSETSMP